MTDVYSRLKITPDNMASGMRATLMLSLIRDHDPSKMLANNIVPVDELEIVNVPHHAINVIGKMSHVIDGYTHIERAKDPRAEAIKMYEDICVAISYIHSLGIMIYDITREQIFFHKTSKKYCLGNFINCYYVDIFPLYPSHEETSVIQLILRESQSMWDDFNSLMLLLQQDFKISNADDNIMLTIPDDGERTEYRTLRSHLIAMIRKEKGVYFDKFVLHDDDNFDAAKERAKRTMYAIKLYFEVYKKREPTVYHEIFALMVAMDVSPGKLCDKFSLQKEPIMDGMYDVLKVVCNYLPQINNKN